MNASVLEHLCEEDYCHKCGRHFSFIVKKWYYVDDLEYWICEECKDKLDS